MVQESVVYISPVEKEKVYGERITCINNVINSIFKKTFNSKS